MSKFTIDVDFGRRSIAVVDDYGDRLAAKDMVDDNFWTNPPCSVGGVAAQAWTLRRGGGDELTQLRRENAKLRRQLNEMYSAIGCTLVVWDPDGGGWR